MIQTIDPIFHSFHLRRQDHVACLVSGGIDSMVLMEMIARFRKENPFQLSVLHFNHHLRGEESNEDEAFVKAQAHQRGLSFIVIDGTIKKGSGVQERARTLRRETINKLSLEQKWKAVLTAHHADDQLETVIMKYIRGAGLRGLKGMEAHSRLNRSVSLLRPLLQLTRQDILVFAEKERISYREDSSNQTDIYFRNRVRHYLIPELKRTIPHLSYLVNEYCQVLQKQDQAWVKACRLFLREQKEKNQRCISIQDYLQRPQEVRFRVLESLIKKVGFKKEFLSSHFKELEQLLHKKVPLERDYGSRSLFVIYGNYFGFIQKRNLDSQWSLEITGPGKYWIKPLKRYLSILPEKFVFPPKQEKKFLHPQFIQKSSVSFPMRVRFPQRGDRFHPYGSPGTKKVSDYLIDKKVPRYQRKEILVLFKPEPTSGGDEIICLVGYEIDHAYRAIDSSKAGFKIVLEP